MVAKEEKTNQAHEDYIDWGDMPLEAPNSGVDLTSAFRTLRKEIESNSAALRAYGTKFTKVMTQDEMFAQFNELDAEKIPGKVREL